MLNWLKKGAYRSLTDVLQAIRREIVSLQPKDTSSVKWTKGVAGMEAHVISVESAESVGSPNLLDDIVEEDDLIKGHFQLYSYTDLETNIEFVAVMNTENDFDNPLEAQPNQCVVRYKGTTNTYSTTYDIKTFRINYTSLSENKNYNVYLMIPFMKQPYIEIFTDSQPVTDANLEYIYIGRVRRGEYNPVITQAYKGGVLYFDSAQYFGAFKVIDSSYTETVTNEEGEEEEIEVSQISVINPEGNIAQVVKLNNSTAQFASRVNIETERGNHIYIHAQAVGTDWAFTIETGEILPSSVAWDVYYRLGTFGSDGRISQIHTGNVVSIPWYFVCPPEPIEDEEEEENGS